MREILGSMSFLWFVVLMQIVVFVFLSIKLSWKMQKNADFDHEQRALAHLATTLYFVAGLTFSPPFVDILQPVAMRIGISIYATVYGWIFMTTAAIVALVWLARHHDNLLKEKIRRRTSQ